ncbi:unnamed protein product, partial [Acidocella sp. C78]
VGAGFGWVVELDAANPMSFPVKRTALGRLPRAGVACGLAADGSAVVFMSEDGPMGRPVPLQGCCASRRRRGRAGCRDARRRGDRRVAYRLARSA